MAHYGYGVLWLTVTYPCLTYYDVRTMVIGACLYNFEGERQAALGNVTCKEVMMKAIRSAHSLLGKSVSE